MPSVTCGLLNRTSVCLYTRTNLKEVKEYVGKPVSSTLHEKVRREEVVQSIYLPRITPMMAMRTARDNMRGKLIWPWEWAGGTGLEG